MNRRTVIPQLTRLAAVTLGLLLALTAWQTASAVDVPCPPNPDPQTYGSQEIILGTCDAQQESFGAVSTTAGQLVPATAIPQLLQFGIDVPTCDNAYFLICRGLAACHSPGDPATVVACDQQGCRCRTAGGDLQPCGQAAGQSPAASITGSFLDPGDTPYRLVSVNDRFHCAAHRDAGRSLRVRYYHGQDVPDETCAGAQAFVGSRDFEWYNAALDFPGDVDWQRLAMPSDGTLSLQVTAAGAPDLPPADIQLQVQVGAAAIACAASTQTVNAGLGGYPEVATFPVHAGDVVDFGVSAPAGDWEGPYTLRAHFVPANRHDSDAPVFARLAMQGNEDHYGFFVYTIQVQDKGSGLRELRPVREVECATCITAVDGEDCATTPPLPCTATNTAVCNHIPPPICTVVTWQPFTPGTHDPVEIRVFRGPDATAVATWHFGTHVDAADEDNNGSDFQEYHYLMPKQWLSLR